MEEVLVLDSTLGAQSHTIQRNVVRMIFLADSLQVGSVIGSGVVKIRQGTTASYEVPVEGHYEIVVDVIT